MILTARVDHTPWLLRPQPNPQADLRLFCLPYAGGGASSFRGWAARLPEPIEVLAVQLPGHESRLHEPCLTAIDPLVRQLAAALRPYLDRPFALFGHSLGALLGFELARELRRQRQPAPAQLFVAARRAPQLRDPTPPLRHLSDERLLAQLAALNGTAPAILAQPKLMRRRLPVLRADLAIIERYRYTPEPPLDTPIAAPGGAHDLSVSPQGLPPWGLQTSRDVTLRMLPSDHFFVASARELVLQAIVEDMMPLLRQRAIPRWIA